MRGGGLGVRRGGEYLSQNSLRFESADILSTHLVNCSAPPLNKPQLKTQNQTAQPGKSHAQLNASADLPFVIDERYRSLICYITVGSLVTSWATVPNQKLVLSVACRAIT